MNATTALALTLSGATAKPKPQPALKSDAKRLQAVWSIWHRCPPEASADERIDLLTGFGGDLYGISKDLTARYHALRRRFPKLLPLAPDDYEAELSAAKFWTDKIHEIRHSRAHFAALLEYQLAFAEAGSQRFGRLASLRAARELHITNPGLLNQKIPCNECIHLLHSRCEAYLEARHTALRRLNHLLFPKHLLANCLPEKPTRVPKPKGRKTKNPIPPRTGTLRHLQDFFDPTHESPIPLHLIFARLDALDLCEQESLRSFFRDTLPRLDRAHRHEFYKLSIAQPGGKDARLLPLAVWLCDNAPIFATFDWRPQDIFDAADGLQLPLPPSALALGKQVNDWKLGIKFKRGVPPVDTSRISRSMQLLTPRPRFLPVPPGLP